MRATDVAGNVDATPASFTFTVDTTPANTTITSSPPAASSSTGASFSFTASDAGPGFECRLDGGAFADCSSPQSYTGLTEAAHTFEVRAEDAAGNVDATPAAHAWTVDLTAPNTSFLSTPANPSANATPSFGLGSTESPSTFECNLDGAGWSPCSTPFTTPSLGDGSHKLAARATDAAGNTDATEVTYHVGRRRDGTDRLDHRAGERRRRRRHDRAREQLGRLAGSGVATVVFQRSPAASAPGRTRLASWDTTAQADGDYDLRVVTTDNAGNAFTSARDHGHGRQHRPVAVGRRAEPGQPRDGRSGDRLARPPTDDGSGVANVALRPVRRGLARLRLRLLGPARRRYRRALRGLVADPVRRTAAAARPRDRQRR